MELLSVGKSLERTDGRLKVTGSAVYTGDLELSGMLYGKILRSNIPHAKILNIDTSKAERLPGVICVLSRNDIIKRQDINPFYGPVFKDQSVVAIDKVRYVGDIVAAVAAVDEDIAEEALDLIEIEYEELPGVFDPVEAMKPDSPLLHDLFAKSEQDFADLKSLKPIPKSNICNHFILRRGDIQRGFSESDYIFEETYTSPAIQHSALEPHATIASVDLNGKVTVWSSTQTPFIVRTQIASIFKVPVTKVRVIVPYLGGGFGAKTYPKIEPIVSVLAWKAKKPVKIMLSREEVFYTVTKHATIYKIKTGMKEDGTIVARECEMIWDTGAYGDIGPRVTKKAGSTLGGPYNIPNILINSYCVYTNKPPAGAYRGLGVPQSAWAYECHIDMIAEKLGIDPLEIRRKNLLDEGGIFATGEILYSIGLRESLEKAAEGINWKDKLERKPERDGKKFRGKGIACFIKSTLTPSNSSAMVKINEDGSLTVITAAVEMGQGADTVLRQIAADSMGVTYDMVALAGVDTDVSPYDLTTSSSRATFCIGIAIQLAIKEAKDQLLKIAGDILEVSPDDLEIANNRVYVKGSPEKRMDIKDVVKAKFGMRGGNLIGQGAIKTGGTMMTPEGPAEITSAFWFIGASAAEVEVDTETGKFEILKYVAAVDVGKAINPAACEQQLIGGIMMGLGITNFEEMIHESGQLINPTFVDYRLPVVNDMPKEIVTIMIEKPHPDGPFGAKGVGEISLIPMSSAIANAIYDAIGVRIRDLPLTPEKVLRAIEEKRSKEGVA